MLTSQGLSDHHSRWITLLRPERSPPDVDHTGGGQVLAKRLTAYMLGVALHPYLKRGGAFGISTPYDLKLCAGGASHFASVGWSSLYIVDHTRRELAFQASQLEGLTWGLRRESQRIQSYDSSNSWSFAC